MQWKCPACQTPIRHDADLLRLRPVYRCHVCRLELVFDVRTEELLVAPPPSERAADLITSRRHDR